MKTMKPPAISLFTGAGGFDLGVGESFDIRFMTDNDPSAIRVLKGNWTKEGMIDEEGHLPNRIPKWYQHPEPAIVEADITQLRTDAILEFAKLEVGECILIYGSPPCQGISVLGKKNDDDPRNDLWFEFFRVVNEARPRYFTMENVSRIMSMMKGEYIKKMKETFEAAGYTFEVDIVNAKHYGVPQNRRRAWIRGQRKYPYEIEKFIKIRYDADITTLISKKTKG